MTFEETSAVLAEVRATVYARTASSKELQWAARVLTHVAEQRIEDLEAVAVRRRNALEAKANALRLKEAELTERERNVEVEEKNAAQRAAKERADLAQEVATSGDALAALGHRIETARAELECLETQRTERTTERIQWERERAEHSDAMARGRAELKTTLSDERAKMTEAFDAAIGALEAAKPTTGFLGIQIGETGVAAKIERIITQLQANSP